MLAELRARLLRRGLVEKHGACMLCGHSPKNPWKNKPRECSQLCCHEIANGPNRIKALDKPFAILVLCWFCNQHEVTNKAVWPEARQLAVLKQMDRDAYDLAAYNALVNPNAPLRITEDEVDEHVLR